MTNYYPRETDEFQPVLVTIGGVPVTDADTVEFSLTPDGERPVEWAAAVEEDGEIGFRVVGLAPGVWEAWCRIGTAVDSCGFFYVT